MLTHRVRDGRLLEKGECNRTLRHIANLWGYRVRLVEVDPDSGQTLEANMTWSPCRSRTYAENALIGL